MAFFAHISRACSFSERSTPFSTHAVSCELRVGCAVVACRRCSELRKTNAPFGFCGRLSLAVARFIPPATLDYYCVRAFPPACPLFLIFHFGYLCIFLFFCWVVSPLGSFLFLRFRLPSVFFFCFACFSTLTGSPFC
jgi:hypothetical protein